MVTNIWETLGVEEIFRRSIKKWYTNDLEFRTLEIAFFTHNTTRDRCIKITIFVCGWCQAILGIPKSQIRVFPFVFSKYSITFPVVYSYWWILRSNCMLVLWETVYQVCGEYIYTFPIPHRQHNVKSQCCTNIVMNNSSLTDMLFSMEFLVMIAPMYIIQKQKRKA